MKAGFLLDVNVLIAMAWPTHSGHEKVMEWLSRHAHAGWATCPMTQTAFVRILSNPAFSPDALTPREAVALLETNFAHPAHRFWQDDLGIIEALELLTPRLAGHQQVTDAYLLGLAINRKGKLATMDRGILALLPDKNRGQDFLALV